VAWWCDLPADQSQAATLREGRDFTTPDELALTTVAAAERQCPAPEDALLAEAVLRELDWLRWSGELPGGVSWDEQPAWRVELYEAGLNAQDRARDTAWW